MLVVPVLFFYKTAFSDGLRYPVPTSIEHYK